MTRKTRTPEKTVKDRVKRELVRLGAWYCMPNMSGFGRAGVPDFIGCYMGRMFAIECKSSEGRLTDAQRWELAALSDAGALTMCCGPDDVGEVEALLVSGYQFLRVH